MPFLVEDFEEALQRSGLVSVTGFSLAMSSSLHAKKFLILTGLSGSGKTQMALAFSKWLSSAEPDTLFSLLQRAITSSQIADNYDVLRVDGKLVELINKKGSAKTIIPLPTLVVFEWFKALRDGVIDEGTDPKESRHIVGGASAYQKYIHGFYTEFFKIAAQMIRESKRNNTSDYVEGRPGMYELISVGADWTSNENLLGYPDALKENSYRKPDNGALALILRAQADSENPYFLILDEMNLSHVERYFADFLSAMESGEPISLHDGDELWDGVPGKLKIPKNLFVIGTVNVDETTYMFSPKVLDRANVIEFRVSDDEMKTFLANPLKPDLDAIAGQGAKYANAFVTAAKQKDVPLDKETREAVTKVLMEFFPQLKEAGAEFGYRTAHEICRFVYFYEQLEYDDFDPNDVLNEQGFIDAMDAAIMQKLLPKLHGSKKKLGPVLAALIRLCLKEEARPETDPIKEEVLVADNAIYPVSLEKLARMRKRLAEHGFTSFAEA